MVLDYPQYPNRMYRLYKRDFDSIALMIMKEYLPGSVDKIGEVDINYLIQECLFLNVRSKNIAADKSVLGLIAFEDAKVPCCDLSYRPIELDLCAGDILIDMSLSGNRNIPRQQGKMLDAQKRLKEMERSLDQLYEDQRESFEAYKAGMTEKDTFLQQKQIYEQLEERLNQKIRMQKEAVEKLEEETDAMPNGLSATMGEIQADHLTRELTEVFLDKVFVWPGQKKIEIR